MLGEAKLLFSANLQETLGISWYEGALVDTIPMVPDRLSYTEMAKQDFLYPSIWTEDYTKYLENKDSIINQIKHYMENYDKFLPALKNQVNKLDIHFFSGKELYQTIQESI